MLQRVTLTRQLCNLTSAVGNRNISDKQGCCKLSVENMNETWIDLFDKRKLKMDSSAATDKNKRKSIVQCTQGSGFITCFSLLLLLLLKMGAEHRDF